MCSLMTITGTLGLLANIRAPMIAVRFDDGIILSANKGFLELFDYAHEDLVGASIELLSASEEASPRFDQSLLKQNGQVSKVAAKTRAGWPLRLDVSVWHFHDSARLPIAAIAIDAKGLPGRLLDVIAARHNALLKAHEELRSAHNDLRLRHDELEAQRRAQSELRQSLMRLTRRAGAEDVMQRLLQSLKPHVNVARSQLQQHMQQVHTAHDEAHSGQALDLAAQAIENIHSILEDLHTEESRRQQAGAHRSRVSQELHLAVDLLAGESPAALQIDTDVEEPLYVACQSADLNLALTNVIAQALAIKGPGRVRVLARGHGQEVEIGIYRDQDGESADAPSERLVETELPSLGLELARDALLRCGGALLDQVRGVQGPLFRLRLPRVTGEMSP